MSQQLSATPAQQFLGIAVSMTEDGLFRINDLHKASGGDKKHQPRNWLRNDRTKETIELLESRTQVQKRGVEQNQVVRTVNGGDPDKTGTYICEDLVYSYAMWISPEFELEVISVFRKARQQKQTYLEAQLEYHLWLAEEIVPKRRMELARYWRNLCTDQWNALIEENARLKKQLEEEQTFSRMLLKKTTTH